MFTGIVERTASVSRVASQGGNRRLVVRVEDEAALPPWAPVELGESIAVDGVCLTAVEIQARTHGGDVAFDVVP